MKTPALLMPAVIFEGGKLKIPWDKVEKVFRLFFPEFSNKVTWAVVVAGLALTSASVLEKILEAIFKSTYDIEIFGGNDAIIGVILVFLGLTHNIVLQREKTKIEVASKTPIDNKEQREHDRKVFEYLNYIMDENTLEITLNCLEVNHAYFYTKYGPVEKFMFELNRSDNAFADDYLNTVATSLKTEAERLNSFIINNFQQLRHGTSDDFLCLHPYWNCDREGTFGDREQDLKYDAAMNEMLEIVDNYRAAYASYRRAIKARLSV